MRRAQRATGRLQDGGFGFGREKAVLGAARGRQSGFWSLVEGEGRLAEAASRPDACAIAH